MKNIIWIDESNKIDFEKFKKIMDRNKNKCDYDPFKDAKLVFVNKDMIDQIEEIAKDEPALMAIKESLDEEKQAVIDSFAGQVLQGMMAGFYSMDYAHGWKNEDIAKECYNLAEAMYKERNQRSG